MSKKISFAVVGIGRIGKRHATVIDDNKNASLAAVCDINPDAYAQFQFKEVPFFNSITELLNSNIDVDVVNICTPNGIHAAQTIEALNARKHVVVEKPMALFKSDAEKVIFKSLQVSRHLFTVMQNRWSPPIKWLKELISQKRLGEIFMVQINCFWNRDDRYYSPSSWHGTADMDGGVLFTQFSHFIDIMYWLFGDICSVKGNFHNFNHQNSTQFEDTGSVSFNFVNGGMGNITYSTSIYDQNFESSITIIGEKGTVKVGGQYMDRVEYCHINNYEMPALEAVKPPNDYGVYKGSASNHSTVIENVIDTVSGNGNVATNALEGMKVVEIIERIYKVRDNCGTY
ncbi:Gfo/Idh/MocA family oxidoreductase [Marinilabiliaceae bacterium ANBcel2]|nr:Gfo/Idh/MocA family oxidoreductase [Marinilabiliaceae bacterium ANBcel2]